MLYHIGKYGVEILFEAKNEIDIFRIDRLHDDIIFHLSCDSYEYAEEYLFDLMELLVDPKCKLIQQLQQKVMECKLRVQAEESQ